MAFTCSKLLSQAFASLASGPLQLQHSPSMSNSAGGRGRGWYYKQKYGGGSGRHRQQSDSFQHPLDEAAGTSAAGNAQHSYTGHQWELDDETHEPYGRSHHQDGPSTQERGDVQELRRLLQRLDGKNYKAYKDIQGAWRCGSFLLLIDHVQGDPYAAPSRVRAQVQPSAAQFPGHLWSSKLRRVALADWLARRFGAEANRASAECAGRQGGWHGVKGGQVSVDVPGQHVLERTAVLVSGSGGVEARFTVGLPGKARTIMGDFAAQIITQHVIRAVNASLFCPVLDESAIWSHIQTVEDTDALRKSLPGRGLVGFVGDGSILPRQSGVSDLPMSAGPGLVPFAAPDSLAVELHLPHRGRVRGLGIKSGITLIAGGGFHGKSTLLQALEVGVYNKIPSDGRELVVMVPDAVKVSAEDGRRVEGVDISFFINNLPGGSSTAAFRSDDASGSTSQAANIQEVLEAGCRVLLMDEDTCATNFMMRDSRMAALVAADKEPITPFSSRIASLRAAGVSTVLVMGGSGDYFAEADTVIVMDNYRPSDQTAAAHAIAAQHAATLAAAGIPQPAPGALVGWWFTSRVLQSVHPGSSNSRDVKTYVRGTHHIQYGDQDIQLRAASQLVDKSQTHAVADALKWLQAAVVRQQQPPGHQRKLVLELLVELDAAIEQQGLDVLAPHLLPGNLARPRIYEIAAALNRIRTLKVTQQPQRQQPQGS